MPLNPVIHQETLSNPIERGNPLNDPQFVNREGYNSYDLNGSNAVTPRFGEVTPIDVFETVPGDRHRLTENSITVLNQLDARCYSEIRQYVDYFLTPLRCIYPINYEKIIPNPTKGDDVPDGALPQIPLLQTLWRFREILGGVDYVAGLPGSLAPVSSYRFSDYDVDEQLPGYAVTTSSLLYLNSLLYIGYILSRGQLLDYLGYSLDVVPSNSALAVGAYASTLNKLQYDIDRFFASFDERVASESDIAHVFGWDNSNYEQSNNLCENKVFIGLSDSYQQCKLSYKPISTDELSDIGDFEQNSFGYTRSGYRAALYDCFERGLTIATALYSVQDKDYYIPEAVARAADQLANTIGTFALAAPPSDMESVDFNFGYINPSRVAAYQMSVAEYMTNDSVDNIFNAQLYMQNLRAVMFPSVDGVSSEPVFDYNGVSTEYDLLTTGAFYRSFLAQSALPGAYNRMQLLLSMLFVNRRSLRYGDYFATGRPNLLAVGQLQIPVSGGAVNPLDVNRSLVVQRFLNAVNWIGSKFVNYMASIFGVKPVLTEPHPVFVAHRTTTLGRDTVTNTADEQGKQTTNLIAENSDYVFDVFADDFGVMIGVVSYDALPFYPAGIDRNFKDSDRYSLFNSMLQNVGDQPIFLDELSGVPQSGTSTFAYTVRYAQYKFGSNRAHGAFVNSLPGRLMQYPAVSLSRGLDGGLNINPDFIRDKPFYFDQFFSSRSGMSPGDYYHFEMVVNNDHKAARKMQYQPPVL